MPALTPRMHGEPTERPEHLARLARVFDRIEAGEKDVRVLVSAPPQHGKSEVIAHGLARMLSRHPAWPLIYASYSDDLATEKSRTVRDYARAVGVVIRGDADAVDNWLTPEGGGLRARGILSGITGNPAKGAIVDDPTKNRQEAESALVRQRVWDEFASSIDSRVHPGGFIIVCMARWHEDDLFGRLERQLDADGHRRWEVIHLPAIKPDGQPLWHKRPLRFLEEKRMLGEHEWLSLWMGTPRPRGARVFGDVSFYDKLPTRHWVGKGIDLAYSGKRRSHYSAAVVILADADEPDDLRRRYYVVDVRRRQVSATAFTRELEMVPWPGAWHWFTSSTEKGAADLMTELAGVDVEDERASTDKLARAQAFAAAWNDGRVFLPRTLAALKGERATDQDFERPPEWLRDYVDEIGRFTGQGSQVDDLVDASASAFEKIRQRKATPRTGSTPGYRYASEERGFY